MKEIGQVIELVMHKLTPQGVYLLTDEDEEILLPNKYVPLRYEFGDKIEVFVYTDSEDRPVATTLRPYIKMHECEFLEAIDVNSFGAFFDWGMEKDLLVPFSEQKERMEAGKKYLILMYKDELTNRLVGTSKIGKFIRQNRVEVRAGDKVNVMVSGLTDIGYNVIVENKYYGLIYKNEVFKPIRQGDKLKAFVTKVRGDNKLDLSLNSANLDETATLAQVIYEQLLKQKGTLNLSDKSNPEEIYATFKVSKKAFKRAIGLLYSERKIEINPKSITLLENQ